ncbi:MAG: isocitrate lyase/PEP mutase family protein [Cyanobacteriota bacterium]
MKKKTTVFKELVLSDKILMLPVAHDTLCAKIAEISGFKSICNAGYANSATLLGKPDVSLLSLTEMVDCASRMVDAVNIPVFADGDTGHGGTNNVIRTVKLFEKAGVAGLFIEDQVFPKRCGHMSGKQVIPADEMITKIKASVDARKDDDFVIMARTDALAVNGIDDAIERGQRYREAGADIIFVEAPNTVEQMKRIVTEIDAPSVANLIPGGHTPLLSIKELEEIGFAVVAYPTASTYIIAKAVKDLFDHLVKTGSLVEMTPNMIEFELFNKMVGLPEIRATEEKYHSNLLKIK